jgi:ribosomal protein S18 acetylase RimI-like enzyme
MPGTIQPFCRQAVLRDGTPVRIRLAHPDDEAKVMAAFGKLDKESVYTRYFSFKKELSSADLALLYANDGQKRVALVVMLGAGAEEIAIAGCSYVVEATPAGKLAAEVAFTVEEDYQGRGIAGMLLDALAGIAREHDIDWLAADVLASNAAMLAVFRRSGLPLETRREGGVIHLAMDLHAKPDNPRP